MNDEGDYSEIDPGETAWVPVYDYGADPTDDNPNGYPPQQCVCQDTWSSVYQGDRYTFPHGGCHNPDNDVRPWCFTKNNCGYRQEDGTSYQLCENHCR
eukprot:SAG22_NODE_1846_length_3451_cov_2.525358_3_plen_98_part_00